MGPSSGFDIDMNGLGSVTIFHVESATGISLFLTPLAFSAATTLLRDIGTNVSLSYFLRIGDDSRSE